MRKRRRLGRVKPLISLGGIREVAPIVEGELLVAEDDLDTAAPPRPRHRIAGQTRETAILTSLPLSVRASPGFGVRAVWSKHNGVQYQMTGLVGLRRWIHAHDPLPGTD